MMKLKLLFALLLSFFALTGHSQIIEPIKWNATLRNTQDKTIKELVFTAQLDGRMAFICHGYTGRWTHFHTLQFRYS